MPLTLPGESDRLRPMKATIFVALAALAISPLLTISCTASDPNQTSESGLELQTKCKDTAADYSDGYCTGFIVGSGQVMQSEPGPSLICIPGEATVGQAKLVVIKYLNDHPEILHLPASILIRRALTKAWPCPVKMK